MTKKNEYKMEELTLKEKTILCILSVFCFIGMIATFNYIFLKDIPRRTLTFYYESAFYQFDIECYDDYCYPKFGKSFPGMRGYDYAFKKWAEEYVCIE